MTAHRAGPVRTVEHSVTVPGYAGFPVAVKVTDHTAAMSGRRLTFDFTDGQKVPQGWNASGPGPLRPSPRRTRATATTARRATSTSAGGTCRGARHDADRRAAPDPRPVHGPVGRPLRRARRLPQTDAARP